MGTVIKSSVILVGVFFISLSVYAEESGFVSTQFYDPYVYPRGEHLFDIDWQATDETLQALKSGKLGRRPASIDDMQNLSRPYEGGRDEQPITVQEDLPRPTVYWTHKMVYREVIREIEEDVAVGESTGEKAEEKTQ